MDKTDHNPQQVCKDCHPFRKAADATENQDKPPPEPKQSKELKLPSNKAKATKNKS
jgi:ribosome-binding protein aMBF1 (putative translation factor)